MQEFGCFPRADLHLIGEPKLNLAFLFDAADAAVSAASEDVSDIILSAANSMPANASDFDRGIAAGIALARYLDAKGSGDFQSVENFIAKFRV